MTESEQLIEFEKLAEMPMPIIWPHRRVCETKLYRQWSMNASVLKRIVLYLKAGLPISPGLTKTFYETKAQEESARYAILDRGAANRRPHRSSVDMRKG
jgi:hypothetical protein